jgi:hypothetical protein
MDHCTLLLKEVGDETRRLQRESQTVVDEEEEEALGFVEEESRVHALLNEGVSDIVDELLVCAREMIAAFALSPTSSSQPDLQRVVHESLRDLVASVRFSPNLNAQLGGAPSIPQSAAALNVGPPSHNFTQAVRRLSHLLCGRDVLPPAPFVVGASLSPVVRLQGDFDTHSEGNGSESPATTSIGLVQMVAGLLPRYCCNTLSSLLSERLLQKLRHSLSLAPRITVTGALSLRAHLALLRPLLLALTDPQAPGGGQSNQRRDRQKERRVQYVDSHTAALDSVLVVLSTPDSNVAAVLAATFTGYGTQDLQRVLHLRSLEYGASDAHHVQVPEGSELTDDQKLRLSVLRSSLHAQTFDAGTNASTNAYSAFPSFFDSLFVQRS